MAEGHPFSIVLGRTTAQPGSTPSLLGDLAGTFSIAGGAVTGSWEEIVAVDPFGVTCSGYLDFGFEITNDQGSGGSIFGLNFSRFPGYTADVGYVPESGGLGPTTVTRTIGRRNWVRSGFNNTALLPGGGTDFVMVATNATTYGTGGNLFINVSSFRSSRTTICGQINNLFEPTFVGGLIADLIMSIFLLPTLYVWMACEHDVLPQPEAELGYQV